MTIAKLTGARAALVPVIAVLFLAMLPQMALWLAQGAAWNGSYFVSNYDETAYSAYVNSLIQGHPRKNDPFLGLSDGPESPQPETLYSIQFIPAYAIALPAKVLGLSVSAAFILLAALIAIFSALAIHKLLDVVTGDGLVSMVGPIAILCLGTAVAYQGELRNLIEGRVLTDYLPFLRRYQPGLAFPLIFVFFILMWKAVRAESIARLALLATAGGLIFTVLVYSYFYLWTAAFAWLVCFGLVAITLRAAPLRNVMGAAGIIASIGLAALLPYFYLLSQRTAELDSVQLLTFTRVPALASTSMWIGILVGAAAVYLLRADESRGRLTMVLAFAFTPIILFNQQIVTGRSLQPVHYELFIANYMVLTAAVLLLAAWRSADRRTEGTPLKLSRGLVYLGIAAFAWGSFEAYGSTSRNFTPAVIRDASLPPIAAAVSDTARPPVILATNFVTADIIPSVGSARPL